MPTQYNADTHPQQHKKAGVPFAFIAICLILFICLLVLGIVPRLRRNAALAQDLQHTKTASPGVLETAPHWVAEGGLTLPGSIEAISETSINARTSGYLRKLFVDIGSRVKAGQIVAQIEAPDVDQQAVQAAAQTNQSQAVVVQSQADVNRQRAGVAQNAADAAKQRATVEQARSQVASSQAAREQAQAGEQQTESQLSHLQQSVDVQHAAVQQAEAQRDLASVTNDRYQKLAAEGFDSQQDADQSAAALKTANAGVNSAQAALKAAQADVVAGQQAVNAAKHLVSAAEANVDASKKNVDANIAALQSARATVRYAQESVHVSQATVDANRAAVASNRANENRYSLMRSFENVVAPFDGVITSRNVDVGALIAGDSGSSGGAYLTSTVAAPQTGMLGIARTDVVRIQVQVPQSYVPAIRSGSTAVVTVAELPGRQFTGNITLRAGAMDPASRTLLAEVHLPNPKNELVPGMYTQVEIRPAHAPLSLRVPGTALLVDGEGTRVATISPDSTVEFKKVTIGNDYGKELEVTSGLTGNEKLVDNPSELLTEGEIIKVVTPAKGGRKNGGKPKP